MLNQLLPNGDTGFFLCPSAVTSGMPVLIGDMPAVAVDAYSSTTGGTTFVFAGVYALTVIAQSSKSPISGLDVLPGDQLFATGTFDAPTNVTYNLTIDKTRGNIPFGAYFPVNAQTAQKITSGATNTTAPVKIGLAAGPHGL